TGILGNAPPRRLGPGLPIGAGPPSAIARGPRKNRGPIAPPGRYLRGTARESGARGGGWRSISRRGVPRTVIIGTSPPPLWGARPVAGRFGQSGTIASSGPSASVAATPLMTYVRPPTARSAGGVVAPLRRAGHPDPGGERGAMTSPTERSHRFH